MYNLTKANEQLSSPDMTRHYMEVLSIYVKRGSWATSALCNKLNGLTEWNEEALSLLEEVMCIYLNHRSKAISDLAKSNLNRLQGLRVGA